MSGAKLGLGRQGVGEATVYSTLENLAVLKPLQQPGEEADT